MKKYSKWLFYILTGISCLAISCKKQLETQVYGKLAPANFFQSASDFNSAVISLYSRFSTDWGYTDPNGTWYANLYNADPKTYIMGSELTTDELQNTWYPDIQNFTWTASNATSNATYYALVPYIARATGTIANMQASTKVSDAIKNKYVAEAKALRAWMMYILYGYYGPVNVKLDPATLTDTAQTPRLNAIDYSAAIVKDINDALPYLEVSTNTDAANWGRVNQGTALMTLLRLYMHDKNWNSAITTAKKIIALGAWSLQTNYQDVFNVKANSEIIYAVPSNSLQLNYWPTGIFPGNIASYVANGITYNVTYTGWSTDDNNGFFMPASFYNQFESGDLRKNQIIKSYTSTSGQLITRSNPIPLKYTNINGQYLGGSGYGIQWVVYRYAEVLLSLAEAENEVSGPTSEDLGYVAQIRSRAGLSMVGWASFTQAQLRDAISDENGREFYDEGKRRSDLIRQGKFIQYAKNRGVNAQAYQTLFPIPENIILQGHGVVQQNPGY